MTNPIRLSELPLPPGIRSRQLDGLNGLSVHVLESGFENGPRPCLLLLHGFPELAFSWRKIMLPLAAAGYHVIAPDQRGYGRTTGWSADFDADLCPFRVLNLVRDALGVASAFGYRKVAAVIGHDFGSPVAAYCALIRPDMFQSVVLMSAPFSGPPAPPFSIAAGASADPGTPDIHQALARLPRPRKHYQKYYSTREANANMLYAASGVHDFLRAYFHFKSADWQANKPFPLREMTVDQLTQLPAYYIMDDRQGMAETVANEMPTASAIAACSWLSEPELAVYSAEFSRTGFQGGLNWYRCSAGGLSKPDLEVFSGRTIDVPSCFLAGRSDWGVYQVPRAFEVMQEKACTQMRNVHLIERAGHWVQQEAPEAVANLIVSFLADQDGVVTSL